MNIDTAEYFYEYIQNYCDKILHEDYLFARKYFLKEHSCSYRTVLTKPLKILNLYSKNKFQIFLYNMILFTRFYIRRFFRYVKNK